MIISFAGDKPELLFICTGIVGRVLESRRKEDEEERETDKYWEVNSIEEDLRVSKKTLPERIAVPFLYFWENPNFKISKRKFSSVFSKMNRWMDMEKKGKIPAESVYGHSTCFKMIKKKGKKDFFSKSFTLGERIKVKKGGYLDGGQVYVADSAKLEKERPLNKACLETLELTEKLVEKTCLDSGEPDDRKKVMECIEHFASSTLGRRVILHPLKERLIPSKLWPFLIENVLDKDKDMKPDFTRLIKGCGAKWVDFQKGRYMVHRKEKVQEVLRVFNQNQKVVIVSGVRAAGKTTFLKQLGYKASNQGKSVIYIDPWSPCPLPDPRLFEQLTDSLIIVDDAHLDEGTNYVNRVLSSRLQSPIVIGMRPLQLSPESKRAGQFQEIHANVPNITLEAKDIALDLARRLAHHIGKALPDIRKMLDDTIPSWRDDLWHLVLAFKVLKDTGSVSKQELMSYLKDAMIRTLPEDYGIYGAENVLLPLAAIYQLGDIAVAEDFLVRRLGIRRELIDALVRVGEVGSFRRLVPAGEGKYRQGEVMLHLFHSSRAEAYCDCFQYYDGDDNSMDRLAWKVKEKLAHGYSNWIEGAFYEYGRSFSTMSDVLARGLLHKIRPRDSVTRRVRFDPRTLRRFLRYFCYGMAADDLRTIPRYRQPRILCNLLWYVLHDQVYRVDEAELRFREILASSRRSPRDEVKELGKVVHLLDTREDLFHTIADSISEKSSVYCLRKALFLMARFFHPQGKLLVERKFEVIREALNQHVPFPQLSYLIQLVGFINSDATKELVRGLDYQQKMDLRDSNHRSAFGGLLGTLAVIDKSVACELADHNIISFIRKDGPTWTNFMQALQALAVLDEKMALRTLSQVDLAHLASEVSWVDLCIGLHELPQLSQRIAAVVFRRLGSDGRIRRGLASVLAKQTINIHDIWFLLHIGALVNFAVRCHVLSTTEALDLVPFAQLQRKLGGRIRFSAFCTDFAAFAQLMSGNIPELASELVKRFSVLVVPSKHTDRAWYCSSIGEDDHVAHSISCDLIKDIPRGLLKEYRSAKQLFILEKMPCEYCESTFYIFPFPPTAHIEHSVGKLTCIPQYCLRT